MGRLLAQIAAIVSGDNPVKEPTALWARSPEKMHWLIQDKLPYLTRQEAGESGCEKKLQSAEAPFGAALVQKVDDPFQDCGACDPDDLELNPPPKPTQ